MGGREGGRRVKGERGDGEGRRGGRGKGREGERGLQERKEERVGEGRGGGG